MLHAFIEDRDINIIVFLANRPRHKRYSRRKLILKFSPALRTSRGSRKNYRYGFLFQNVCPSWILTFLSRQRLNEGLLGFGFSNLFKRVILSSFARAPFAVRLQDSCSHSCSSGHRVQVLTVLHFDWSYSR